jgi:type IV secretion system protein VirB11
MLNAYMCEDGMYEGHIWYEEAGVGMKRLITTTKNDIPNYPIPKIGEFVVYKSTNTEPNKILNYHVLTNSSKQDLAIIATVLKNVLDTDESGNLFLNQDEHYLLNVFADNIKHGKFHHNVVIPEELILDIPSLIHKINEQLPNKNIFFKIYVIQIKSESELAKFSKVPTYLLAKKFEKMTSQKARQIMGILSAANDLHFHDKEPTLECAIPFYHHRFTGIIPPVVKFPTFTIRKHSSKIITLDQYVESGVMPATCRVTIRSWVKNHFNILIAGGTGSGKTTMGNAILNEISRETPQDRVAIIEDTPELQCNVDNSFSLCKSNERDLPSLLRTTLRMRPDRVVVGELRGKEAYTLLKAWMSGHPGGLATIHANGAKEAIYRFEQCISENPESGTTPKEQIAYAVNGILSIQKVTVRVEKDGHVEFVVKRKVTALREIRGYDKNHGIYEDIYLHQDDSPFEIPEELPQTSYLEMNTNSID